ncbi:MAG TPA: hypothetical protein VFY01_03355 [Rheinheimera sp.]|nr:hypothetical protein [Rheinheimera sp.]
MRLFYLFFCLLCVVTGCQPAEKAPVSPLTLLTEPSLQLQLTPGHAPVETPLQLQLTAAGVTEVSGELTGVSMYMGRIPLRFVQQGDSWQADFLLGACSDPDMLWQLQLELHFADGQKRMLKQQFHSSWH